jgi:hemerythrin-like domain-containing protein
VPGEAVANRRAPDAVLDLDQVRDRAPSDKIDADMLSMANDADLTRGTVLLRAEHEWVSRVLGVAERMADRALHGSAPVATDRDGLLALLQQFVDHLHHSKEEQHLFPLLERKGLPRAGGPIGVMLGEHERGRALIGEIVRLGASLDDARPWGDAVRAYATLMRSHIEKENTILFVMAERLLSSDEQEQIARACAQLDAQSPGPDIRARLGVDLARLE